MTYPILKYDEDALDSDLVTDLNLGAGLRVQGADPLQRWAYRASAFYQAGQPWGEAFVQTGRYALHPSLNVYDRPFWVNRLDASGAQRVGIEERGAELGLRLPVRLQSNVYQTSASFFLGSELRQTRRLGDDSAPTSAFRTRLTLNPAAFLAYRLQANPRDLVPNTGVTLSTTAELDAWADGRASRGLRSELRAYLPWLRVQNTGLSLGAGLLAQNAGVYDADDFVPRGYEGEALGTGTFARFDLERPSRSGTSTTGWCCCRYTSRRSTRTDSGRRSGRSAPHRGRSAHPSAQGWGWSCDSSTTSTPRCASGPRTASKTGHETGRRAEP